ncbi:hypothetical protein [Schlesneria paludicola]|uniref:hypothetical protein n=1 Tax=Schlesneria paludicola TaxID=360056 RepID=UPI00029A50CB|nr:hypothetical protein [Schlesneria paludicola]
MKVRQISTLTIWSVQAVVAVALVASYAGGAVETRHRIQSELTRSSSVPPVVIPRTIPLVIEPLYDDPEVVSDEELAAVLAKIQPRFWSKEDPTRPVPGLKPNYVEHALRTWWIRARFEDPQMMSGEALKDYLVDHGKWLAAWSGWKRKTAPSLLEETTDGVSVRWGKEEGTSVHHDHWLACLTEAGVSLHEPVFTPHARKQVADVLQEALRDFRLDETEVEWSAMAFGFWIAPQREWMTRTGRTVSFDMLAERLMRGHKRFGVCAGTHRLYSLMVLIRLDDDFDILSDDMREQGMNHLRSVRDLITVSQFEDGHWPTNWSEGADALLNPVDDPLFKKVIATGHHLEWLAIAPTELHPPRDLILKAADWVIKTTAAQSDQDIADRYTFFSHVGNALALWRQTHPADFWMKWQADHPEPTRPQASVNP